MTVALVAVYGGGPNIVANGFGIFFLLSVIAQKVLRHAQADNCRLFGIIFSVLWNSGCPVYCTELFPTSIRATGGAIGTFWSFIIQVILAQASPTALANVGW